MSQNNAINNTASFINFGQDDLDYYKESTSYTPTLGDGTNNFTLDVAVGYYLQIGKLVYVQSRTQWTGKGSASAGGNLTLSLPLAVANLNSNFVATFSMGIFNNITFRNTMTARSVANTSIVTFRDIESATGQTIIKISDCATTGELEVSGTYLTD